MGRQAGRQNATSHKYILIEHEREEEKMKRSLLGGWVGLDCKCSSVDVYSGNLNRWRERNTEETVMYVGNAHARTHARTRNSTGYSLEQTSERTLEIHQVEGSFVFKIQRWTGVARGRSEREEAGIE